MYKKRLYIFIALCLLAAAVCISRLVYLQVFRCEEYRQVLAQRRILDPRQLPTVRGSILDRHGRKLAVDSPRFYLHMTYELTRLLDDHFWESQIALRTDDETTREQAEQQVREQYGQVQSQLFSIVDRFGDMHENGREQIMDRINSINRRIWRVRQFHAWSRHFPDSPLKAEYKQKGGYIPLHKALEEFETLEPDPRTRLIWTSREKLGSMYEPQPVIELQNEQELFEAQLAFSNIEGFEIFPQAKRTYPYESAACQLIGWVGPVHSEDESLFEEDAYSRYLHGELIGRDGVEYVCEAILRGRRGEVKYDIEGNLLSSKPTIYGRDVRLALDIELQAQIEALLKDPNDTGIGAVVLDGATGDVLALVSVPVYDINRIRIDYNELIADPAKPMLHKAIERIYPPGSVMKPLVLVAGLEERKISAGEIISCPAHPAPRGWPNCLMFRKFNSCHDWRWQDEGGNTARNAIRGSCNIYFSQLAHRLETRDLQKWIWDLGYGHRILNGPDYESGLEGLERRDATGRRIREASGIIYSGYGRSHYKTFDQVPELDSVEKRFFGIGQGNLRVTVLQVAATMGTILRGGIFKQPRFFIHEDDPYNESRSKRLGFSSVTVRTVKDGMHAVVNERGGTAFSAFQDSEVMDPARDLKIYGKTGSTQNPENAWFGGFVEDSTGRGLAVAIIVEGGQAGSTDAAPKAREIIRLCNEAGYIGKKVPQVQPVQ